MYPCACCLLLSFSWRRQGGLPASSRAPVTNEGETGGACWVIGDCQWLRLFDMMYAALEVVSPYK